MYIHTPVPPNPTNTSRRHVTGARVPGYLYSRSLDFEQSSIPQSMTMEMQAMRMPRMARKTQSSPTLAKVCFHT